MVLLKKQYLCAYCVESFNKKEEYACILYPGYCGVTRTSGRGGRSLLRVLRLGIGDEVMLTDGKGYFYKAVISAATGKRCQVKVVETIRQEAFWNGHLHLAMAPTKNMDRIEWFAEKATEIGFDELTFLNCRFSERKVIKTERVEKIVVSAVKQSLKASKPIVNEMIDFNKFVQKEFGRQKFIAHCYEARSRC